MTHKRQVSDKESRPASLGPCKGSEPAPHSIKRVTWEVDEGLSAKFNKVSEKHQTKVFREDKEAVNSQISDNNPSEKQLGKEDSLWDFTRNKFSLKGAPRAASPGAAENSGASGVRGGKVQPSHNSSRLQEILYGRANESTRPPTASHQHQQRAHSPGVSVGGGMTSTKHMSLLERKKKQWEEERGKA